MSLLNKIPFPETKSHLSTRAILSPGLVPNTVGLHAGLVSTHPAPEVVGPLTALEPLGTKAHDIVREVIDV